MEPGIVCMLVFTLEQPEALSIALLDRSISYLSVIVFGGLAFLAYQRVRARSAPRRQLSEVTPTKDHFSR